MSTPLNLNKARKARERAEARARADENSVKFGRTKAERNLQAAQAARARTRVDAHRLEDDDKT